MVKGLSIYLHIQKLKHIELDKKADTFINDLAEDRF